MISASGRMLAYREGFWTQQAAIEAAKTYRAAWFARGAVVDHRMGACI
jgi:hypothetical protein